MARAISKDLRSRIFIGSIYNPGCAARVFIFSLQYTAESVTRLSSFFFAASSAALRNATRLITSAVSVCGGCTSAAIQPHEYLAYRTDKNADETKDDQTRDHTVNTRSNAKSPLF
jgi:hypothetical protein